ncbi:hypothetical protein GF325_05380, partial [Candidatus Bathyarchaeota archaeon]|nr:hypothetical protein [Candidatus Bathyarchaeota archaeon]
MENERVIVLIRPDVGRYIFSLNYPPLGLGYLAAMLSRGEFKVKIIDLSIRNIKFEVLIGFIKKHQPLFVGITALSPYYSRMKKISTMLRDRLPELPIVLGGVHASSLSEQALKECKANVVAIGESDETILEIANHFRSGEPRLEDIRGIMYRDGETFIKTPERDFIKNLDDLPFPKWDLIKPKWY